MRTVPTRRVLLLTRGYGSLMAKVVMVATTAVDTVVAVLLGAVEVVQGAAVPPGAEPGFKLRGGER